MNSLQIGKTTGLIPEYRRNENKIINKLNPIDIRILQYHIKQYKKIKQILINGTRSGYLRYSELNKKS